ncbi:acetylornithine/succinylornithine family transaminase [Candidatus Micrarchaeota archaeon]|nr:acetylornithine/succinylornithine family transaminase [Candidatus Micrarchaeota archaeon]
MHNEEIMKIEDAYQLRTYGKFPFALEKGKGCIVWDAEGNQYLDFYGGHAVALTGHCHPLVVKAIKEQIEKLIFYSNIVYSEARAKACKEIISISPKGMGKVFLCNSGDEANETALKLARKFTGKNEIIAMKNAFHGRTVAALSVTGIEKYRTMFKPELEHVHFVEFANIENVKKVFSETKEIAAVMVEPIQSMGGVATASTEYFKELRKICDENNALLIFDEVQTGFGRTGKMFASDYYETIPDIITCAKGIASGVPMGAAIINEKIAENVKLGEHGSTFGGSQIACAAAYASIQVIKQEKLDENAEKVGKYIKKKFSSLPIVKEVRGAGLLVGLKLTCKAKEIQKKLLVQGFIVGTADTEDDVIRLIPPLVVGENEVDALYEAFKKVCG